jgi:hypothetical protein
MCPEGQEWFTALKAYVDAMRARRPLPAMATLGAADEARCRLEGGTLLAFLERAGPQLLQERGLLSHLEQREREPFIIVLSGTTGLVAAQEIIGESDRIVWLKPSELKRFTNKSADDDFKWHVRFVNEIKPAGAKVASSAARKYPLNGGEAYWIHHEEAVMGPLFVRGAEHLLKWDGSRVSVLEECFGQWMS